MKLLSYQPFSLNAHGGGSRILRRLYEGHENEIISLVVESSKTKPSISNIKEIIVSATPLMKDWHRWKVRNIAAWVRHKLFLSTTTNKVKKAAGNTTFDVIHVVDHGVFPTALNNFNNSKKEMWVSFHDHFSTTGGSFQNTSELWNMAIRRFVISAEIGVEYQRLFGTKNYEIITDGLYETNIAEPSKSNNLALKIYFAGLLHIDYYPLFFTLADALDQLNKQGYSFELILRGTQELSFLKKRSFKTVYKPFSLNESELKNELDNADFLYLPIKFSIPEFYLYSLSTKMVGYLGASGSILYHGPEDSAAGKLLKENDAAVCCTSLETEKMVISLLDLIKRKNDISLQAKKLARNQFNLLKIQKQFWARDLQLK